MGNKINNTISEVMKGDMWKELNIIEKILVKRIYKKSRESILYRNPDVIDNGQEYPLEHEFEMDISLLLIDLGAKRYIILELKRWYSFFIYRWKLRVGRVCNYIKKRKLS